MRAGRCRCRCRLPVPGFPTLSVWSVRLDICLFTHISSMKLTSTGNPFSMSSKKRRFCLPTLHRHRYRLAILPSVASSKECSCLLTLHRLRHRLAILHQAAVSNTSASVCPWQHSGRQLAGISAMQAQVFNPNGCFTPRSHK